jgi:hypothetical protein
MHYSESLQPLITTVGNAQPSLTRSVDFTGATSTFS